MRETSRILFLLLLLGLVAPALASCCSGKGKAPVSGCDSRHPAREAVSDQDAPTRTCCGGPHQGAEPGQAVEHHAGGKGHDPARCQSSGTCQGRCGCPCFTLQTTPFLGVRPLPLVTPDIRRVQLPVREARPTDGHPDSILHPPSPTLFA